MIDILIFAIGYETRSRHVLEERDAEYRIGISFTRNQKFSYEKNAKLAQSLSSTIIKDSEARSRLAEEVEALIVDRLSKEDEASHIVRVSVDVSSMNRQIMALALHVILDLGRKYKLKLQILYSTGEYAPAISESAPYIDLAPIDGFEGWTSYPEKPLALILGLGYEVDQALAAMEYLDPSGAWAFIPAGDDDRFRTDLNKSNENLWPHIPSQHLIEYVVNRPYNLFAELSAVAETLSQRARVVIVPGGPKIFAALALIVAHRLGDEVSVWRASSHDYGELRDRTPAGKIIEFEYEIASFQEED